MLVDKQKSMKLTFDKVLQLSQANQIYIYLSNAY